MNPLANRFYDITFAPAQRVQIHSRPCAFARTADGSQTENVRAMLGKHPASPAPKRNRTAMRAATPETHPVAAVNNDHQRTTRTRVLRVNAWSHGNSSYYTGRAVSCAWFEIILA